MTDANINPFAQTDDQVNYLEQLVGEGKKFVDAAALARGKKEADDFIETLKRENAELRTKAEQGMSLEDFYKKVREGNPVGNDGHPIVEPNGLSPASPEDIEKMIRDTLSKTENERRTKENADVLRKAVNDAWGTSAVSELKRIADTAGITVKDLEDLGLRSPAAFFKLAGIGGSVASGTVAPTGGFNIRNDDNGVRNQAYYSKLYRENPKLRLDPKTMTQEHKDAIRLGEAFFN